MLQIQASQGYTVKPVSKKGKKAELEHVRQPSRDSNGSLCKSTQALPRTHAEAHNQLQPQLQGFYALFWPLWVLLAYGTYKQAKGSHSK